MELDHERCILGSDNRMKIENSCSGELSGVKDGCSVFPEKRMTNLSM